MPQDAKANLSALIESTEDLIWSVDLDHRFITFNNALRRDIEDNYGRQPAEGIIIEDLLPPGRAVLLSQLYDRALSEGPFRIEYPLADGRTLEMAFNPISVDGRTTGVSVFGKDITERKRAEQALREAESKYRNIFDGALEGMFQTSLDFRVLSANSALARMLGYRSGEEIVSSASNLATEVWADREEHSTFMRQIRSKKTVHGFECRFKRRDGAILWASLNCRKTYRADDRTTIYEGFIEDITERKQAEVQLRDSEERFRKTFEQAPVGIVHTSFEGRILRCNSHFAEIAGYLPDEIVGLTQAQITLAEDHAQSAGGAAKSGSQHSRHCHL